MKNLKETNNKIENHLEHATPKQAFMYLNDTVSEPVSEPVCEHCNGKGFITRYNLKEEIDVYRSFLIKNNEPSEGMLPVVSEYITFECRGCNGSNGYTKDDWDYCKEDKIDNWDMNIDVGSFVRRFYIINVLNGPKCMDEYYIENIEDFERVLDEINERLRGI